MLGRERVALALLAVSGACFLPGALDRFVFPKLAVAAAGAGLAMTVPPRGRLPRDARVLLGLGALVLLAAALNGPAALVQLIGRAPRYEGAIALSVYLGAGLSGARLLGPGRARGSTAWFLDCLAVASAAIAIEAILETAGLRPLASDVARPGSLLGNADDEGAWAVLALGPLAAVALRAREPLHILGAVSAAAIVVCSASRGALLGALVVGLALLLAIPRGRLRLVLALAAAATVAAALALPATRARVTGSSPYAGRTASGRLLLWSETVRLIAGHPLLGAGPGGYIDAIPAYHDARYERRVGPQTPPDSPHDWLLQAAAAGGLPLLVLVLALAGLTVVCGRRAVRRQPGGGEAAAVAGMLAGVAGYGVALLFFFTTPGSTPLAALLGGALLATESPPAAVAARLTRAAVAAALAALTLLLAAAAVAEIPLRDAIDAAARLRLPASDRDFGIARDLRPWDPAVDAAAAHAFAVLAGEGVAGAACDGLPWARRELAATPDSIEGLGDGAELDLSAGRFSTSVALLARARRDDPANPLLAAQARLAEQDLATGPAGGRRRAGCPGAV